MYLIRDYHDDDAKGLNALAIEAFEQYSCHYSSWTDIREKLGNMSALAESAHIFVAECNGKLIGAVAYLGQKTVKPRIFKPEWSIMRMLVVAPNARNQGIGRALAEACIERAKFEHVEAIALHTSPIMSTAVTLYESLGFIWSHSAPEINSVNYDVYLKKLSARMPSWTSAPETDL